MGRLKKRKTKDIPKPSAAAAKKMTSTVSQLLQYTKLYYHIVSRLDQIRLDQIRLDWIGLDWIGLDWIGLDWIGLDWIRLDLI